MATAKKRNRKGKEKKEREKRKKGEKKKKGSGGKKRWCPLALARQKKSVQVTSCQLACKDGSCKGGREKDGVPWL